MPRAAVPARPSVAPRGSGPPCKAAASPGPSPRMGIRSASAAAAQASTMPRGGGSVRRAAASPGPRLRTGSECAGAATPLVPPAGRPAAI
eukprot:6302048-Lingulodinium_polyedra.AAC.1